jgi:murein DD-endopeptidase MepM/ murein hydrolase activator NlpD
MINQSCSYIYSELESKTQMLNTLLDQIEIFPIMGTALDSTNTMKLDFSPNNKTLVTIDLGNTDAFNTYVFGILEQSSKTYGIGGYFEYRSIYRRSEVFATAEEDFRNIHLGIDIWAEEGHPVYAPLDGKVHSFQDNAGFGNYGPTIILEHQLGGVTFYSLYGHLALSDLENLEVGQKIRKGELFCHLGPFPENGDWPPHLHFQLMWDLMGMVGDFPGVCSQGDTDKFQKICPNPNILIGFK